MGTGLRTLLSVMHAVLFCIVEFVVVVCGGGWLTFVGGFSCV